MPGDAEPARLATLLRAPVEGGFTQQQPSMIRFVHSSDLHIGKRFGNFPEDLRGRLREARHLAIDRLAEAANAESADFVVLAGDSFDTETPTPAMLRQALAAMAAHPEVKWVMLPGNHDSLLADELWSAAQAALPCNVVLANDPRPICMGPEAVILPAPCTTRRPGRDLTEWMDGAATAEGAIRIGLAHGPVLSFSEDGSTAEILAPDRAKRAGLDYLALGDWHGPMQINERTWYCGTPEPDRFKHEGPGQALSVSIAGSGAPPEVKAVETGSFRWSTLPLTLFSDDDPEVIVERALPPSGRRQALLRLAVSGRTRPATGVALQSVVETAAPEFAHLELDTEALAIDCDGEDLDRVDHAGALRAAAESLLTESRDDALSLPQREIARLALMRLFSLCETVEDHA